MEITRRQLVKSIAGLGITWMTSKAQDGPRAAKPAQLAAVKRKSKSTLTPVGLNHEQTLRFTLQNGRVWEMTLLGTSAEVIARSGGTGQRDPHHEASDISVYAFSCAVLVNGHKYQLHRAVGSQASFYEPWNLDGVRVWFDAVSCVFKEEGGFMGEKDRQRLGLICRPDHHARFAIHEADMAICPEPMMPWYPNDKGYLDIRDCYNGEDCWMGPYNGGAAHCGLDINMPAGTLLFAPISFDNHYLFNSTKSGYNNNRWRGIRRWPDGSTWWLQSHHLIEMKVPELSPLNAGTAYATTAGVFVGRHEHTHFNFRIIEQGGDYLLDPWILFWEIFRQQRGQHHQ